MEDTITRIKELCNHLSKFGMHLTKIKADDKSLLNGMEKDRISEETEKQFETEYRYKKREMQ
jgi:hypothetical protein